ncbi:gliding motility-associated C-terminal domain-containing protein [uncultured Microscilla sp.]|uniref:T9SS type B sorting domain-containing protein n=1 Tax=uncultured Microscilla sp. TaxID=432653 RepID=UPI0026337905|nr:gliding motility-associated C-terminal domain-containing protein [uncultured Microscilla sp.]
MKTLHNYFIALCLLVCCIFQTHAQVEPAPYSVWYFGQNAGFSFDKKNSTDYSGLTLRLDGAVQSIEACSSIADSAGNLQFYTDGLQVWNKLHQVMINGAGLKGNNSASQSVMILPKPKATHLYYVFTIAQGVSSNDMYYSVVDMSRHNGLGEVIQKNVLMQSNMTERVTATLHNNGDDYWVMTHEANSDRFFAFALGSNGVNVANPVISIAGSKHVGTCGSIGYMKVRCNRLAVAITNCATATTNDRVEVFNFNNSNGRVTRHDRTYKIPNAYGVEFSTTAKYLFVSGWHGGNLFRIDLSKTPLNPTAVLRIATSNTYGTLGENNSFGALMMGPDRKIYVAKNNSGFLGVINEFGLYQDNIVSLGGKKSRFGLPNIPQFICECDMGISKIEIPQVDIEDPPRSLCINSSIQFNGKETTIEGYSGLISDDVRWDFGDPRKDSLGNASIKNPAFHIYQFPGVYTVKLYRKCFGKELLVAIRSIYVRDCAAISAYPLCINSDSTRFSIVDSSVVQSIVWDFGDPASGVHNTSTLVNPKHKYRQPGSYEVSVQVVYKSGYRNTYKRLITIYDTPKFNLGPDINTCNGDKIPTFYQACQFQFSPHRDKYKWHDGSDKCYYFVKPTDSFVALTIGEEPCATTDTVWFLGDFLTLGPDQQICPGDSVILRANGPWESYLWHDGSTDSIFVAKTTGRYTLTASRAGCTATASVKVEVVVPPSSGLPRDTTICPPRDMVFLDASQSDSTVTYLWSTGDTTAYNLIQNTGTYWVDITKGKCKRRDSIDVNIVRPIDLPDTLFSCAADSITALDAYVGVPGATYAWSNGSTDSVIVVKQKGWYKVTASYKGCVQTDSTFLDFSNAPIVDIGKDTVVCSGKPFIVDAFVVGKNYTYEWNTGANTSFIEIKTSGVYTVTVSNDTCTTVKSIQVTIPALNLGKDRTVCDDAVVYVSPQVIIPGATYTWNTLQTGDSIRVLPPGGQIIATMTYQGCTLTDTVNITMVPKPTIDLGKDTTLCDPTQPLVLSTGVTGTGIRYLWSNGSTTPTLTADTSGVYWVEVRQGDCPVYDTITINYLEIKFPKDTTVCQNQPVVLDASQPLPATYRWQDGSTFPIFFAQNAGIYWVDITMGNCSRRDTVKVNLVTAPGLSLGQDTVICDNQPLVLTSGNPATVWSTGVIGSSITVDATGTYTATIASGGCIVTDSIQVTYLNESAFDLGANQTICDQSSYVIDATKGLHPGIDRSMVSYLWADDNSNKSFKHVTQDGWYKVKVSFNAACSFEITDSVYVSFGTSPNVNLGKDRFLCPGETLRLNATSSLANVNYLWQDGSQSATYTVTRSGTYWVKVDHNGCMTTDSVKVVYSNDFSLGGDRVVCGQQTILLNAFVQGATRYLWQDGSTQPYYQVTQTGTYWVEISNGTCNARDSVYIEYVPQPSISLGADTIVCNATEYTLHVSPKEAGVSYVWNNGSTDDSLPINKSGWYWVDAIRNTCKNRDSVFVFLPSVYLSLGGDTTICAGTERVLGNLPVDGLTYQWSTGATTSMITVTKAGDYFLEVNMAGCTFRDRVKITVRECDPETDNLFIPNIITPNNDGKNDQFVIEGISNKGWALEIYNRWGSLVYQTGNYTNNWSGGGLPSGMYYYHLKHPQKTDKRYKGWVKILR